MPLAGFEPQTLGASSSDRDHYTMPLPLPNAVNFYLTHDWQSTHLGVVLRHHLANADVQPTQKSRFTLQKKFAKMKIIKRKRGSLRCAKLLLTANQMILKCKQRYTTVSVRN